MLLRGCLTLLEPQSRSGDKPVKFQVVLSPNGTAVLKGLRRVVVVFWWTRWRDVGCSSIHVRHISFDLSWDTAALLFWRVLHFLLLIVVY